MIQKLKRNWRGHGLHKFWPELLKSLKPFFVLIGCLWRDQSIYCLSYKSTEELCKFWRKTDQWFEKGHEKFGKFSPEHLELSKLELWWDPFVQSRKDVTLKFAEELCVMTIKNNAKFEGELTFHFKINMRNLTNFDSSTRKSQKIAL